MKVNIRAAKLEDTQAICDLLKQMGYPQSLALIQEKFEILHNDSNSKILIAEEGRQICGFLSLYFIPQIALQGDFAKVCYLCVGENIRSKGIGRLLLQKAEQLAIQRGCDRMELHSGEQRTLAHQFYLREGYVDAPKYFRKKLN